MQTRKLIDSLDHNGRSTSATVTDRCTTNASIVSLEDVVQGTNNSGS